jgi:hypothetical protein
MGQRSGRNQGRLTAEQGDTVLSTYFIPDRAISFNELRSFHQGDVRAVLDDGQLMLTDGQNYLHVFRQTKSWPIAFERCGANNPDRIIEALQATYKVRMVSEYDDDFETIKKGHRIGSPGTDS